MARGPKYPSYQKADLSLLSEEEIKSLRSEAEKQVLEEQTAKARKDAIKQFVDEARHALSEDPNEDMVDVFIDLPDFCDRITLDGRPYLYNHTYTVPRPVYDSLQEAMSRAADHQTEIDGKSKFSRESRRIRLSPHGMARAI